MEPALEEIISSLRDQPLEFSKLDAVQQGQLLGVVCPLGEDPVFVPESFPDSRFRCLKDSDDRDVNFEHGWLLSFLVDEIAKKNYGKVAQLMKFFRVEVVDTYAWIDPDREYPPCFQIFPFGCFSSYPGPIKRAPGWLRGIYSRRFHHTFFELKQVAFDRSLACSWKTELTAVEFLRDFLFIEFKSQLLPRIKAMMDKLSQIAFVPELGTESEPYLFLAHPCHLENVAAAIRSNISRPVWSLQNYRGWDRRLQQGIKTTLLMIYCRQKEFPIRKDLRFILLRHLFDAHLNALEHYENRLLDNLDRYSSLTQRVSVCLRAGIVIPYDKKDYETRKYIADLTKLELGILPESDRKAYRESLRTYLQSLPGAAKVRWDLWGTLGIFNDKYILDYCEEFGIDYTLLVNKVIGISLVSRKFFSYLYRQSGAPGLEPDDFQSSKWIVRKKPY